MLFYVLMGENIKWFAPKYLCIAIRDFKKLHRYEHFILQMIFMQTSLLLIIDKIFYIFWLSVLFREWRIIVQSRWTHGGNKNIKNQIKSGKESEKNNASVNIVRV